MIGFRMDGHENMRDKVGWNSVEKQDHESMPNINRKICKSQIVMNEKLWPKKKKGFIARAKPLWWNWYSIIILKLINIVFLLEGEN